MNVSLKGDGTLDAEQRNELMEVGKWLDINGEAIYGTRPWKIFGEGPTKEIEGHYKEFTKYDKGYVSEDVRFTQKGDVLYAIILDWDENREINIKSLAKQSRLLDNPIKKISLLGNDKDLVWNQKDENLNVSMPEQKPCEHAYTLKIEF